VIAIADDGRFDGAGVGAGVRLGETEGGELGALGLGNEPAQFLLLGTPLQEGETVETDMYAHDDSQEGIDVFELIAGEGERNVVETETTVLLGDGEAEDTELTHFCEDFRMKLTLGVPLLDIGRDLTLGEFAHHVANLNLLLGETEIHRRSTALHWNPPRRNRFSTRHLPIGEYR
jgi:hypothetical protein